jgi:hypothetical protein
MYWSGHGIMKRTVTRRLFYADATRKELLNLNIDSLLESFRSISYNFPRQLVIVDACANYAELMDLPFTIPDATFPVGDPDPSREQFVMLASRPGQPAINLDTEQAGAFSKELMNELRQSGPAWPPDVTSVANRLGKRFNELRGMGKINQTPVFYSYRDWIGNEHTLGTISSRSETRATRQSFRRLTTPELQALRAAVCQIPWMLQQQERDALLRQIRNEIHRMVPRDPKASSDVFAIVETCNRYPGGLEEFLRAIRATDPNEPAVHGLDALMAQLI